MTDLNAPALAASILMNNFKHVRDYEISAAEDMANGFRPKRCIHGTYAHTNYDVMCLDCEDDFDPRDMSFEDAMDIAKGHIENADKALTAYFAAVRSLVSIYKDCGMKSEETHKHIRKFVRRERAALDRAMELATA